MSNIDDIRAELYSIKGGGSSTRFPWWKVGAAVGATVVTGALVYRVAKE